MFGGIVGILCSYLKRMDFVLFAYCWTYETYCLYIGHRKPTPNTNTIRFQHENGRLQQPYTATGDVYKMHLGKLRRHRLQSALLHHALRRQGTSTPTMCQHGEMHRGTLSGSSPSPSLDCRSCTNKSCASCKPSKSCQASRRAAKFGLTSSVLLSWRNRHQPSTIL